ncbi:P1 family peptidase [uncultured Corynebacterium sp.]|uniref:P1 family peptidase n=1 Tax=uncultured Corynebacterium sp. TaxID=159447 RepID=UPI0025D413B9|nr:P1 family peptidase [uncultured Corynebacterium sp.]
MIRVGHVSLGDTGVTALYCGEHGAVASVDVRGGGPGTRETDLLEPHNTVERVHAIVLSGGSAFGLAAADGAMRELATHGIGFPVFGESIPGPRVPIVPGAVIFDLIVGEVHYPAAEDGAVAICAAMAADDDAVGTVGAGCGATAGKLRGGFGRAALQVPTASGEFTVEAFMVANPVGEVIDVATGRLFGDPRYGIDPQAYAEVPDPKQAKLNTTIGAVATDAPLTKAQAKRLALTAHDGIARAVRPAHSPLDGDTIFGLSTAVENPGVDALAMAQLCAAAADAVEAAIVAAVTGAVPGYGLTTYGELAR